MNRRERIEFALACKRTSRDFLKAAEKARQKYIESYSYLDVRGAEIEYKSKLDFADIWWRDYCRMRGIILQEARHGFK